MNSTPDIAEPATPAAPEVAEPANPPEDARWGSLLDGLTPVELRQYASMTQDQIAKETRWNHAYLALLVISLGIIAWVSIDASSNGFGQAHFYQLCLAALFIYWPYRSLKTKQLWRGHYTAVQTELAKRGQPGSGDGATATSHAADDSVGRSSHPNPAETGGHQRGDEHEK